jgi:hypothetical protein
MEGRRMTTGEIAKALAAFQADMPVVAKNKTAKVPTKAGGSYSYTYADLADITEAAMPLLTKHGLSFACLPGVDEHGPKLTGTLLHTSGETLAGSLPIRGATPQEVGSSLTYMRRYLLGCITGLVTDDDEDGQLAENAAKRKPAAKKAAAPKPPDDERLPDEKPMTARTRGEMFALFDQKGIPDDQQLEGINRITGASYTSRGQLSEAHGLEVVAALRKRPDVAKEPAS